MSDHKCPECERSFATERGLEVHLNRTHRKQRRLEQVLVVNHSEPGTITAPKKRRGYYRRAGVPATAVASAPKTVNFCPCCGTPLAAFVQALNAAEVLTHAGG